MVRLAGTDAGLIHFWLGLLGKMPIPCLAGPLPTGSLGHISSPISLGLLGCQFRNMGLDPRVVLLVHLGVPHRSETMEPMCHLCRAGFAMAGLQWEKGPCALC